MAKQYIFFLDVDGTLVARGTKRISDETIAKIKDLKKKGYIFVISTGRVLSHALMINDLDAFDYLSVLFGSRIYKSSNMDLIYRAEGMKAKQLLPVIEYLKENNIMWSYKDEKVEKTLFPELAEMRKDKKYCVVTQEELIHDVLYEEIIQLLVLGQRSAQLSKLFPAFNFFDMPGNYTDVVNANVSKAKCVEFFRKLYPNHVAVSIGDSANDLAMFEAADISVAMGNATDDIKKRATFVTRSVTENGVINAFEAILER